MKNINDKAISEKLAGLDTLPPGYEPNLDSKWKLLETAMLKQKDSSDRIVYIWMTIAASFLVICSVGIKLYFDQDEKIVVQKKITSLIPLSIKRPSASYFGEHKRTIERSVKIQMSVTPNRSSSNVSAVKSTDQSLLVKHDTVLFSKDSIVENPESEIMKTSVTAQRMPAKKNKQRYVQLDFGDLTKQPVTFQEQGALSISFGRKVFESKEEAETDMKNAPDKSLILFTLNINRKN